MTTGGYNNTEFQFGIYTKYVQSPGSINQSQKTRGSTTIQVATNLKHDVYNHYNLQFA